VYIRHKYVASWEGDAEAHENSGKARNLLMKFTVLAQKNEIPETQHDLDSRTVMVDIIST